MTATGTVHCACCRTARSAAEVYERVPRSGEFFCRDTAGCRRRTAYVGEPVGDIAVMAPPAVAGAACAICGTADAPVYERTPGMFVCLDRSGCDSRAIETQFLTSHRDHFPQVAVTSAGMMMHAIRDAGAPAVPADRPLEAGAREQADRDAAMQLAALGRP